MTAKVGLTLIDPYHHGFKITLVILEVSRYLFFCHFLGLGYFSSF